MGIRVPDAITLSSYGLTIQGCVITCKGTFQLNKVSRPDINPQTGQVVGTLITYTVTTKLSYYASLDAYQQNKQPIISNEPYTMTLDVDHIKLDILNQIYASLKIKYPSAIDV